MVLRIGQIDYANCTPIFSALQGSQHRDEYRFFKGAPTRLNRMLSRGEIDLCPCSSIEYARSPESYFLLPDLSISSIGPVRSVILFSALPLEKLDGTLVGLSTESASSVALLKIILGRHLGFSNRFHRIHVGEPEITFRSCSAVLVIGDTALKWNKQLKGIYRYDLGELWYSLTGLPFVFALWLIRKDTVEEKPAESARLSASLIAAKRRALSTLDRLADECGERIWMGRDELLSYWETISYDLTDSHLVGVRQFFRSAAQMGLLDKEPELRFFRAAESGVCSMAGGRKKGE